MNCYQHPRTVAVGACAACGKGVCLECVGHGQPAVLCRSCAERGPLVTGIEYISPVTIGDWPLVHVCARLDPLTGRPKVAKGVIAIGNVALGVIALGGAAFGVFAVGGVSMGLLFAVGGVAVGLGLSLGGLAIGVVAIGGVALGIQFALGGTALGPATIDPRGCDAAAREFFSRWFGPGGLPPNCG